MNHATFMGWLAFDLELKIAKSGTSYLTNSLTVRRPYKDAEGNKGYDNIPFIAYGKIAETISHYLKKGDPLLLSGSMTSSINTMKVLDPTTATVKDKKIQSLKLSVESFEFVPTKTGDHSTKVQGEKKKEKRDPKDLYYSGDELAVI